MATMAMKLGQLISLSDAELEQEYNKAAETTVAGLNYFWYEILRREQDKQTKWIIGLTVVMTVAAVLAAIGTFAN